LSDTFLKFTEYNVIMATEAVQVLEELKLIKEELTYIKHHMPDKEMFLDAEEKQLLEESFVNEKREKLLSRVALRRKLGI